MKFIRDLFTDLEEILTAPGLSRVLVITLLVCCLQAPLMSSSRVFASLHREWARSSLRHFTGEEAALCPEQRLRWKLRRGTAAVSHLYVWSL